MVIYVIIQLLLVSIGATSAMTWFSFAMSKNFQELYKEPVLLAYALEKTNLNSPEQSKKTWGWLLHYIIGFLFVYGYHIIWVKDILAISPLSALLLGAISGVVGIISWVFIFKITHHQPPIDFKGYYIQLFFAHIIFAIIATVLYSITLTILILTNAYVTV
ncbi:hypothetical protein [Flavobacterium johnsoniae]|jgi:hypothetical protein|uniref:DUF2938 family protein n=1 Tax=Flavobacterium johnsoniae TaxID=986 RepID=A0A1M5MTI8_FLAJO|nr:hypothetical protein [Flavobacterium johnsoniae]SHG80103.1 hypothetical protein SAMN05444388_104283 [Flavobacterium johnsoniae]